MSGGMSNCLILSAFSTFAFEALSFINSRVAYWDQKLFIVYFCKIPYEFSNEDPV